MAMKIACSPSPPLLGRGRREEPAPVVVTRGLVRCVEGGGGGSGIELDPYGCIPLDVDFARAELGGRRLSITAGTILDDLVSPLNSTSLLRWARDICALIQQLLSVLAQPGQRYPAPSGGDGLVPPVRDQAAGRNGGPAFRYRSLVRLRLGPGDLAGRACRAPRLCVFRRHPSSNLPTGAGRANRLL